MQNRSYRHIIFDFDGVLAETNSIRVEGFESLFRDYPQEQVNRLVQYAGINGGVSRYKKIRYFFERIRSEPVSDDHVLALAKRYSELVKLKVIDAEPVKGSIEFLKSHHNGHDFAVVSGSDQEELREICKARKIDHYFIEILGAPVNKESNIALLLSRKGWRKEACLYIGDSINDLDAARFNGIDFIARDAGFIDWSLVNNLTVINDLSELKSFL